MTCREFLGCLWDKQGSRGFGKYLQHSLGGLQEDLEPEGRLRAL